MPRARITILVIVFSVFLLALRPPVDAGQRSFGVTARSEGFSPASLTVDAGDAVSITFSVPADDSYCCGLQVKAPGVFDTGAIARGQSQSVTFTAASSLTFSSYWPATSVHKADGTVTVQSATNGNANGNANTNTNANVNRSTTPRCRIKGDVSVVRGRTIKRYYTTNHPRYRKIRLRASQGDRYFCTVKSAQARGFRRAS